jgi:3-oxoadipate enol-lactonase
VSARFGERLVPTRLGLLHVTEAGPADGEVALAWPSLFTDGEMSWGAQLPVLHARGWRTLLVDPPGAGRSPSASRTFTMEECARAALQILDHAGVDHAAILGLSWGGFVALRVALAAPERVSALVLSNTSARPMSFAVRQRDRASAWLVRAGVPGGPGRLVVRGMLSKDTRAANPVLSDRLKAQVDGLDKLGLSRAMVSVLVDRTSVVDSLGEIRVPTLVVAGDRDEALPLGHAEELVARIVGARLEVLEGAAHLAPREDPAGFAALLDGFLAASMRRAADRHRRSPDTDGFVDLRLG